MFIDDLVIDTGVEIIYEAYVTFPGWDSPGVVDHKVKMQYGTVHVKPCILSAEDIQEMIRRDQEILLHPKTASTSDYGVQDKEFYTIN